MADFRQRKRAPAIQIIRNAGFIPQELLHTITGQPFLIRIGQDDFHRVIGRLNGIVLRFIVMSEQLQQFEPFCIRARFPKLAQDFVGDHSNNLNILWSCQNGNKGPEAILTIFW